MKKAFLFLLLLPLAFSLAQAWHPPAAEAARLGGGRSFGGSPAFNRPIPMPQQRAPLQNPGMAAAPAASRGAAGFLGPMLAGGLLGALIFGGAFSGLQAVDMILILALIFIAYRLLSRKRAATAAQGEHGYARQGAANPWDALRSPQSSAAPGASRPARHSLRLPPDFDLDKFMEGAKIMYARLQESWDKRDLEDISQFAAPEMYRLIRRQCEEDPAPGRTDILTLQAELHDFHEEAGMEHAAVYFDALLREYAGKAPENARELWSFIRSKNNGGTWKLFGIQQVED